MSRFDARTTAKTRKPSPEGRKAVREDGSGQGKANGNRVSNTNQKKNMEELNRIELQGRIGNIKVYEVVASKAEIVKNKD